MMPAMGERLVIRGGLVAAAGAPAPATMVVEAGRIAAVVPAAEPVPPSPGDWEIDAAGRLVVPGAVDAHTHLALGALARLAGLPGQAPAVLHEWRTTLHEVVEPRADAEAVEALTAAGAAAALKAGVTCAFDLLRAAPGQAAASLDAAARALQAVGLRAVLAYAASDRAGPGEGLREAGAAATFAERHREHPTLRGAGGLDGLDAAADGLLAALGPLSARHGLLASVAEDDTDLTAAYFRGALRPIDLLAARGLLGPRTVVAHGSTTVLEEAQRLASAGAALAATPRAAAFWGTPLPPMAELAASGAAMALGTDGLFPDVACELVATALFHRGQARSPRAAGDLPGQVLWPSAAKLASRFFGACFAGLAAGSTADLVILDWRPVAPLPALPLGDLALLWAGAPAAWSIVGGEVRIREGRLLGVDEAEVAARARAAAARLMT
jgi:cytosine/adenosine deaminase-related metal-dependent hydrolase